MMGGEGEEGGLHICADFSKIGRGLFRRISPSNPSFSSSS